MLRIVILDDRKTNRSILIKLAQSLESTAQVDGFAEPEAVLDEALRSVPDLVITDYRMPGMTGAEFIERFRRLPACADVPVIVVTAYEHKEYRYNALKAGATDFLLTPLDRIEFCSRARNLLTLRRQQRIIRRRAHALESRLHERTKLQQTALRESEEKLRLTINTVPAMVSAIDLENRCVFVNNQQGLFFGIDPQAAVGCTLADAFGGAYAQRHSALNAQLAQTGQPLTDLEETLISQTGERAIFLTTKAPLYDANDAIANIVTVSVDITQRKTLENELEQKVYYDPLSNLPNRVLLHDRMGQAIERALRNDSKLGVFHVDLDQFRNINAAWGHSTGDVVLRAIGTRLGELMRPTDTVARLSADEFAVLADGMTSIADAQTVANKIQSVFSDPVQAAETSFLVQASIGIAVYPFDGHSSEELLKNSNSALYRAKAQGGDRWAFYTPELTEQAYRRVYLEGELRSALKPNRSQLSLAAQPLIALVDGTTVGHEMLLRWEHPQEGAIPPDQFIPLAEASGLIGRLGRQVLERACAWYAAAETGTPGRISVNVSPNQLNLPDFFDTVQRIVTQHGVPPEQLELEITENALMGQEAEIISRLQALRTFGISIAIDDFGTGYSSLQYIKSLPVDRLKIDRSFVSGLVDDPDNQAIVKTAVTLGRQFGLIVTAEGVETHADAECLRALDVDEAQGFYYGLPEKVQPLNGRD